MMMGLREMDAALPPGFRFHPSDEELVSFYLRKKVANQKVASGTLVEVDLHAREPWELPDVAKLTAEEWYFFSFRDRKYATGSRTNRATKTGYWKATGKDRVVREPGTFAVVGVRKTLVFYLGRAPNGQKTGWVMHEFRLETPNSPPKEDWVLCRVFNKGKSLETEKSNSVLHRNHVSTLLCSQQPDSTLYDQNQESTASVITRCGSSGDPMMNLAMLHHGSLLDYCSLMVHDDGMAMAIDPRSTICSSGSHDAAVAMATDRVVGFKDHDIRKIETEHDVQALLMGSCDYRDQIYF